MEKREICNMEAWLDDMLVSMAGFLPPLKSREKSNIRP